MAAKKLKFLMMVSLVLCMVLVPITAQAGSATGPGGTAYLVFSYDKFDWSLYPVFPSYFSLVNAIGSIDIYKIVGGVEVRHLLINLGYYNHYNPGDSGFVTGSRPCGLEPGTYKAYLRSYVYNYSETSPYSVTMPIVSETFTVGSSTSTPPPCYNAF